MVVILLSSRRKYLKRHQTGADEAAHRHCSGYVNHCIRQLTLFPRLSALFFLFNLAVLFLIISYSDSHLNQKF